MGLDSFGEDELVVVLADADEGFTDVAMELRAGGAADEFAVNLDQVRVQVGEGASPA